MSFCQYLNDEDKWKKQLAGSIRTLAGLEKVFALSKTQRSCVEKALKNTQMSITPYLLDLIEKGKNGEVSDFDPIFQQYVPTIFEQDSCFEEEESGWEIQDEMFADGLRDEIRAKIPQEKRVYLGQHKYPDKVLLRIAHHCSAYCRFCYERSRTLLQKKPPPLTQALLQAKSYVEKNTQIREVIFSGGDPLALTNEQLEVWFDAFANISTVQSLRLHTRMPAQNPYRITKDLVALLKSFGVSWVNIHVNHPRELTDVFIEKIKLLQNAGILVKRENPIIKNLNDTPEILSELILQCLNAGIYGHHIFHSMPVTPSKMRTSVVESIVLLQQTQKLLGNIRWNASELGDLTMDHAIGKRTIPFEEIELDLQKPREEWGTKFFIFTKNSVGKNIICFRSWDPSDTNWYEFVDG